MFVKKNNQVKISFNSDINTKENLDIDKIKTTNVNILLNRVRLNQRNTLKKRITFSVVVILLVSLLAFHFAI